MPVIRHIITGEYPPSAGGVAGYTAVVAEALAAAGETVHVWCPGSQEMVQTPAGFFVHHELGDLSRADFERVDRRLAAMPGPKRVLLQWVPHAYGRSSLNIGFTRWIKRLAGPGTTLDVMIHEPFLPFTGGVRRRSAAAVHRWMLRTVLSGASRAYVPTRQWETLCRPYARHLDFKWMPLPSGIRRRATEKGTAVWRAALDLPPHERVVGAFGGALDLDVLITVVAALERAAPRATLLLIGAGSAERRNAVARARPGAGSSIRATGAISEEEVSRVLRACDLCVQPYADGVSGRRSSAMAVLAHTLPLVATRGVATEPVWTAHPDMVQDPASIPATTLRLLADPAALAQLARDGRELYDAWFDVQHTVRLLQATGGL